ncbi:MAG: lipoate--protein ligase family protein [Candidatus Omnitrophica bacterium]|nr:lipoate--protein ligase family protein [Candidatus Omnitrophota bacterium]
MKMDLFVPLSRFSRHWRLILSGRSDAARNMAVDEALLENYRRTGHPVFRVYGWSPPAFSLGVAQNAEQSLYLKRCRQAGVMVVRRMTGGGVLFHGPDISYSIVCAAADIGGMTSVRESFRRLCAFLIFWYRTMGLEARFADAHPGFRARNYSDYGNRPDFCLASCERDDLLLGTRKIGGNAQKRSRSLLFQHGSVPLRPFWDEAAVFFRDDLRGAASLSGTLEEFTGQKISFSRAQQSLAAAFRQAFGVQLRQTALSPEEERSARRFIHDKYARPEWNRKREYTRRTNDQHQKKTSLAS